MNTVSLLRHFNAHVGRVAPSLVARLARNLMLRPRRAGFAADPPGARRVTFASGLSGLRWGEHGRAVLLLHGWEGSAAQFAPLAERIVASGRSAVALDAPAHGRSPGREATLMAFARALQRTARQVGDVESVAGHSLGGAAAVLALSHGMRADRAVLIAAPASIEAYLHRFARALALPPVATQRFIRHLEVANGVPAQAFEIARLAGWLRQPVLIVHDRDDARVPFREGASIARAWQGARLLATRGLGHSRVLAESSVADRIAAFLAPPANFTMQARVVNG
ncbi:MAG TPA: alpha/beta fold hydrolase [Verrucomicrobiae bacterium]|nr:alpha/beta fold hydrolase [Verrucomicrobiae bacterium]